MAHLDKDVWLAAMQCEKNSLEESGSFECVTPIHKGHKPIGVHWCFTHKYNPDGSIWHRKEKARLVAQGFSQWEGVDFKVGETYALVIKLTSIQLIPILIIPPGIPPESTGIWKFQWNLTESAGMDRNSGILPESIRNPQELAFNP